MLPVFRLPGHPYSSSGWDACQEERQHEMALPYKNTVNHRFAQGGPFNFRDLLQ
jgi:hypothetical protein